MRPNGRDVVAVVGGILLAIPILWFRSPARTEVRLEAPRAVLESEAAALRVEVDALTARARERAAEVARRALSEDYASYGRDRDVRGRILEEVEAIKSAAPFKAAVGGYTFSREQGRELSVAGFGFNDANVREILRAGADTLTTEVTRLQTLARELATREAGLALRDEYLSAEEEENILARVSRAGAGLASQAKYPAAVGGLTFSRDAGGEIVVSGFSFGETETRQVLDAEFGRRPGTVRERDLVNLLTSLLRRYTGEDQWLDDEERATVVKVITTPEPGKKAALPVATANRVIVEYCERQGVRTGPKAPAGR